LNPANNRTPGALALGVCQSRIFISWDKGTDMSPSLWMGICPLNDIFAFVCHIDISSMAMIAEFFFFQFS